MSKGDEPSEKRRKNRYDYAHVYHQRPNLFPGSDRLTRIKDGHSRAIDALRQNTTLNAHMRSLPEQEQRTISGNLREIAYRYWDRNEFDERIRNTSKRDELLRLAATLRKLERLLERTSPPTKRELDTQLIPRTERMSARHNELLPIIAGIKRLRAACEALTANKGVRQGREALVKTCGEIVVQWTKLTGQPFKHRRWRIEQGGERDGVWKKELDAPDAHFVELMVQAFDPTVTSEQVRSALTQIVKKDRVKNDAANSK